MTMGKLQVFERSGSASSAWQDSQRSVVLAVVRVAIEWIDVGSAGRAYDGRIDMKWMSAPPEIFWDCRWGLSCHNSRSDERLYRSGRDHLHNWFVKTSEIKIVNRYLQSKGRFHQSEHYPTNSCLFLILHPNTGGKESLRLPLWFRYSININKQIHLY
jgi:hypothetical protein